jgi:hypothetical protein
MARSGTSSPRKRFLLSAATAAAVAALAAVPGAVKADIIARPPFFVPQRADNLILSGGRDAGDWETLSALRDAGLPCYGNMCEKKESAASGSSAAGEFFSKKNGFGIRGPTTTRSLRDDAQFILAFLLANCVLSVKRK